MRVEFTPSAELFPFESRWLELEAGRVHYVDEGSGTPILMCHGNPTWSFLYRGIIRRLSERFRCVAVDYPGFGLSDRPQGYGYTPADHARVVGEFADRLGLDRFILMGHDWGGPIGLSVAAERADRVAGLALMNSWCWPAEGLMTKTFARLMSSRPLQRRILEGNFFVERLIPAGTSRKLSEAEMGHYRAVQPTPEARKGVAVFPRQILGAAPWLAALADRAPAALGGKPGQLVWGMRDRAFGSKRAVRRWRAEFPGLEVLELPKANHFVPEDAPAEVSEAVIGRFG